MEPASFSGRKFRSVFVLVFLLITFAAFSTVVWPVIKALFIGAVLAGLCMPIYKRLFKAYRGKSNWAAASTLAILLTIVLGPLAGVLALVAGQAQNLSSALVPWIEGSLGPEAAFNVSKYLRRTLPWMANLIPDRAEIYTMVENFATHIGEYVTSNILTFTVGSIEFFLHAFIAFYAAFFFLRDGRKIVLRILYYTPLEDDEENTIIERFASITRATVKGTLLVGLIQGSLAGIAFYFAGVQGAAFWGAVMVLLSILPGIGAPLVWVPAVIYLFAVGNTAPALGLLAWCGIVVTATDDLLRPILVGKDAQMPNLLILIGTIGGIYVFGLTGFVIGPIICGIFLTSLDIYAGAFRDILPLVGGRKPVAMTNIDTTGEAPQNTTPIAK